MVTWIKSTTCIARAVQYPMTDKPDQKEIQKERIEGFRCGGGILDTGDKESIVKQFQRFCNMAGRSRVKKLDGTYPVQGYRVTYAFSANELDPNDPDSIEKALDIAEDASSHRFKNVPYIMVAQRDGKSGLIHVHEVDCCCHSDTLKILQGREVYKKVLEEQADAAVERAGIQVDVGGGHPKNSHKRQKREKAKEQDGFSWMEVLEGKILSAAAETTSYKDFPANLEKYGVKVDEKGKKKAGWTYILAECEDERFIGKKAKYNKFPSDLSQKALNSIFDQNYREKTEMEKKKDPQQASPEKSERRVPDIPGIKVPSQDEYQKD